MAEGRHGYDVSIGYVANFFRELAPDWLDFCMEVQGFEPPRNGPSFRYLDLGCGQGFHLCLLAAANPRAEFVGIDFDAGHIAHARELAAAAGLENATFLEEDFLDLAAEWPKDVGAFDYIVLQGILSWISPELRAAVFECVAQASKPGTVASCGYDTPPGWLSSMPLQHVANRFSKSQEPHAALESAVGMFRRLRQGNAPLFDRMPHFKEHLEVLASQPRSYLAHELLPDHWAPLWHSNVAQQLRSADFAYVASGTIAEALLPDALPPELGAIIRQQTDDALRQDVQDIVTMQGFRRDIYCRNARASEPAAVPAADTPIHLISVPAERGPVHFQTTFGGIRVDHAVVADILAALAPGPKPFASLVELKNPGPLDTRAVLLCMLEAQMLAVGRAAPGSAEVAERFNAAVAAAAAAGTTYPHLAAAAIGSGVPVGELELLLLDAWLSSERSTGQEELAHGVAQRLGALGRQLQFRGSTVAGGDLQSHIARLVPMFVDQTLPHWRRLGAVQ